MLIPLVTKTHKKIRRFARFILKNNTELIFIWKDNYACDVMNAAFKLIITAVYGQPVILWRIYRAQQIFMAMKPSTTWSGEVSGTLIV